ncbi:MAG: hypothetical protein KGK07_08550 [Chloroflexota bacterium]|nr:hypothetical protein [Chloroflexota bacterium]
MPDLDPRAGLCPSCLHVRPVTSARGSRFLMCARAATDPRFPKYPRLPVVRCPGYERRPEPDRSAPEG